jgi:hypothetical protein
LSVPTRSRIFLIIPSVPKTIVSTLIFMPVSVRHCLVLQIMTMMGTAGLRLLRRERSMLSVPTRSRIFLIIPSVPKTIVSTKRSQSATNRQDLDPACRSFLEMSIVACSVAKNTIQSHRLLARQRAQRDLHRRQLCIGIVCRRDLNDICTNEVQPVKTTDCL